LRAAVKLRALRKEVADLRDANRDRFGVEPICRVLSEHGIKIAPSTYCVAVKPRPHDPGQRDALRTRISMSQICRRGAEYRPGQPWRRPDAHPKPGLL
jgi:hypothetical protein